MSTKPPIAVRMPRKMPEDALHDSSSISSRSSAASSDKWRGDGVEVGEVAAPGLDAHVTDVVEGAGQDRRQLVAQSRGRHSVGGWIDMKVPRTPPSASSCSEMATDR